MGFMLSFVAHHLPFATTTTTNKHSSSYTMGQLAEFNTQLNDTSRRFTYFVPRDWAWESTSKEFPSTHKKLFMPAFAYHVSSLICNLVVYAVNHPQHV